MNNMRAIRTEEDYEAALARIEGLFDAEESTSEEEELNILVDLVAVYEDMHYPIGSKSYRRNRVPYGASGIDGLRWEITDSEPVCWVRRSASAV